LIAMPHATPPLALSDSQLDQIMRLAQPLQPAARDAFLRILAHEFRGRHDIGDGELHRVAVERSRAIACSTRPIWRADTCRGGRAGAAMASSGRRPRASVRSRRAGNSCRSPLGQLPRTPKTNDGPNFRVSKAPKLDDGGDCHQDR
jgi:hypothetical protein